MNIDFRIVGLSHSVIILNFQVQFVKKMAAEDGKLKLLPRHLQRSQPASSSKSKRRVTVEDDNAADEESDRRSVFERLGPGGLQRSEVDL